MNTGKHFSQRTGRRSFLAGTTAAAGILLGGGALAGCGAKDGPTGPNGFSKPDLVFVLPGDVPPGWDRVLEKVNAKLTADQGLTLDVQWIGWSNYLQASLLKYTSGEDIAGSLEATWAHLPKLGDDGALINLNDTWTSLEKDYPNLSETINPKTIETSRLNGNLWGVPQVSNATSLVGFTIRQDLASGDVATFEDFEKFLYGVKQKDSSMVPYGMDNGYINSSLDLFDVDHWETRPEFIPVSFGSVPLLWMSTEDAIAGTARVVPIWEVPSKVEAMERVRTFYQDGILNKDLLNVDKATIYSLFGQGKFGAAVGVSDGQMTSTYGATEKQVDGAKVQLVFPFASLDEKLFTSFGTSNYVSFATAGDQLAEGMALMEWLSIRENHDLLQYGIEGTDWTSDSDEEYTPTGDYVFPGYTLSWRVPLERRTSTMFESEKEWFGFAQDFENFELSPLAGFAPVESTLKTEAAQFSALTPKLLRPLQAGTIETAAGIESLKKGFEDAGLEKVIGEVEKQLGAYFSGR